MSGSGSTDRPTKACYWLAAHGSSKDEAGASVALAEIREAIIPDSHRQKVEAARRSLEEAGEIKGMVILARREQTSAYVPNYAVSGQRS